MRFLPRVAAIFSIVATAAAAGPANADAVDRWTAWIVEAAARFDLPIPLLRDVMRAESGGRDVVDGRPTTSIAGAMGLMQIMPSTWAELRKQHGFGTDPHTPRDNILAGAAYLASMRARYGEQLGVAAYHAGPGRIEAHLTAAVPLPDATREYLATVFEHDGSWTRARRSGVQRVKWFNAPLFVVRSDAKHAEVSAASPRHDGLFVRLATPDRPPVDAERGSAMASKTTPRQ